MKKFLVTLVSLWLIVSPLVAHAAPMEDDARAAVVVKIKGLSDTLDNAYDGKEGLYYNLYYLALKTEWVGFLSDFDKSMELNFTPEEKKEYFEDLKKDYKNFSNSFSSPSIDGDYITDPTLYKPLNLKVYNTGAATDAIDTVKTFTAITVPDYLESRLSEINTKYISAASEDAKDAVMTAYKGELGSIYKILSVFLNEQDSMEQLMPSGGKFYVPGSPKSNAIATNNTYMDLMSKAREINAKDVTFDAAIEDADSTIYLERLAWVTKKSASSVSDSDLGHSVWATQADPSGTTTGEYRLREAYMRMFSATSVYRPLVSHVGDEDYRKALEGLFPDDSTRDKFMGLFDEIKDYRKPVYAVVDSSKWFERYYMKQPKPSALETSGTNFSGTARAITAKEFLKAIKNEKLMGLTVLKGKLKVSEKDINSYMYYNDNPKFDNSAQLSVNSPTIVQPSATPIPTADPNAVTASADPAALATDEPTETTSPESTDDSTRKDTGEVNNIIQAATEEVNSVKWTATFLEAGGVSKDSLSYFLPSLSLSTYKNYFKDFGYDDAISADKDSYLYMNVFGDIVTKDNLVIVPGASNPVYYNVDEGYYPYNVMFMKGYPSAYAQGNSITLGSPEMKGKYILFNDKDSVTGKYTFFKLKGNSNLATTDPRSSMRVNFNLAEPITGATGANSPFVSKDVTTLFGALWTSIKTSWGYLFTDRSAEYYSNVIFKQDIAVNESNLMSYNPETDTDYRIAQYIARNTYKYLTETVSGTHRLREDFLFKNVMVEAMNGTTYATGYERTLTESLDKVMGDSYGWWINGTASIGSKVANGPLGQIDGVLGTRDSREDEVFSKVRILIDKFYIYIVLVLLLFFIVRYMRDKANLWHTVYTVLVVLVSSTIFLKELPIYIPKMYNFFSQNINRELAYNIVYTKSEQYMKTYNPSTEVDSKGNYSKSTTSLDLYHLTEQDREKLAEQYGLSLRNLNNGGSESVDVNSGLYVQGDTLKVNLDVLLSTSPITGSYKDTAYGKTYQFTGDKMFSSALDYYMPYYLIQDSFIDTLNRMLVMYRMPKFSLNYGGGLTKDGYVVYSYINSLPFLSPGEYPTQDGAATMAESQKLAAIFDDSVNNYYSQDFLNLYKMLENPSQEMQNSLWYRTMVRKGIDPMSKDPDKKKAFDDLVGSVNNLTKSFILSLDLQGGTVSDENLTKIISLYATTVFNQKISILWQGNVYPKTLNYAEFRLSDVLQTVLTEDYKKFINSGQDLMEYSKGTFDLVTLIVLTVDIILCGLISFALKYSVPFLFTLLGIALFLKSVYGRSMRAPIMGFVKVSAVVFTCSLAYVSFFSLRAGKQSTWTVWLLLIACLVIIMILTTIMLSVLLDPLSVGNTKINSVASKLLNSKLLKPITDSITTSMLNIKEKRNPSRSTDGDIFLKRFRHNAKESEYIDSEVANLGDLRPRRSKAWDSEEDIVRRSYIFEPEVNIAEEENARQGRLRNLFRRAK